MDTAGIHSDLGGGRAHGDAICAFAAGRTGSPSVEDADEAAVSRGREDLDGSHQA
jgi:hypothetical protein